jgi:O-antigen ligase
VERASRLIVIASMALAVVTHGWLASWQPAIGPAAVIAFLMTFAIARLSLRASIALVAGTSYLAPALLSLAFAASDYHHMLVWLGAAAGPVIAAADWTRWSFPRTWRIPLAGWALVVALTWPIVAGREIDFSVAGAKTLMGAQGIFGAPPPVAAAFVVIFAIGQLLSILWLDMLFARFGGADAARFVPIVVVPFLASATMGAIAGVYQELGDMTWLNPPVWSSANRATGLMLDANTFGTGAAIWAPAAIAAAWAVGRQQWLGVLAFALLSAAVSVSGSRTALLTLAAAGCGVAIGVLRRRGLWQPRIGRLVALVAVALVVVAMAIVPRNFESSSALGRLFARVPRLEQGELKRFAGELWTRFDYGPAASEMIREHPLTGSGVGAFHVLAPDYIFRASGGYRRVEPDNAQNWWRHQVAELGVIGALPSVVTSLIVCWLLVRAPAHEDRSGASTVLRAMLVGIGVASLFGVPTQHPATAASLATLLFFFARSIHLSVDQHTRLPRVWWAAAFAIACATAAGQATSAVGALRVPQRATTFGLAYEYGFAPAEGLSDYGEMRWMAAKASRVLHIDAPWYQLTFWHPRPQSGDAVSVSVALDARVVLERQIRGPEPVSFFLQAPKNHASMVLDFSAQPAAGARTLGVAAQWRPELPPDVPADRVVR